MKIIRAIMTAGFTGLLLTGPVPAVTITISNTVAPVPIDENFASVPAGYVDSVQPIVGGRVGSNFVGISQTRVFVNNGPGTSWWRDDVETPAAPLSSPLTIATTPTDSDGHQNISVIDFNALGIGRSVGGVSNADPDINQSTGQGGAVAILFNRDRSVFGFDVIGRDVESSELILHFFGRNGSLLGAPVVFPLSGLNPIWSPTFNMFLAGTGSMTISADSRAIAGVLITNNDRFGIGYVNLRVPVPDTLLLMMLFVLGWLGRSMILKTTPAT